MRDETGHYVHHGNQGEATMDYPRSCPIGSKFEPCGYEADYQCANCEGYFCENHAIRRNGLFICTDCHREAL